jgi:hypothetical protein
MRRLLLHRPLAVLSLCHSLVVLHRLVDVLPLVAPPSRPLVVLSLCCPLCLIALACCWVASHCTALSSTSHCATLSLSCSGWLLHCLLSHCPLVLSLHHPLVLLLCAGWLLHGLHQTMLPPLNAPTTTAAPATAIAAVTAAAVTSATATAATATTANATTIVELSIFHCLRKRQQQQHHQCTSGSTNVKTFTSPDDLSLFNLSTVFELVEGIQQLAGC